MDQFTKVTTKKIAEDIAAEDFKLDYSTDTVFAKNPITQAKDKKPGELSGWDRFENFLSTTSLNPRTIKKLKVMLRFFKIKDALNRLNRINKSVDDLVKLKTPFGEGEKRYEMLTARLLKANHLRTQIQRELL